MTDMQRVEIQESVWRETLLWLSLTLVVVVWLFYPTFEEMVSIWWNASTFNHCFLIPVISIYLILEKRKTIESMTPQASYLGMLFVFLSSMLWLIGALISVSVFQHVAIISLLIGIVWSLLGNRVASLLMFPLAYLYFSVPEGEFMVPYLMDWTAWVTVKLLRLSGIPVFLEALYISIPTGNFVVAEACSGINYLIASLSLCTVFAYLNYHSWNRRLLFMLLALIVPLVANGLRAYGIVMIAHLTDMKYATGVDHIIYGWFFFGIVIFILFYLGSLFSEPQPEQEVGVIDDNRKSGPPKYMAVAMVTLLLSLSGQSMLKLMDSVRKVPTRVILPQATAPWTGPEKASSILGAKFAGVKQLETVEYQNLESSVYLELAYYDQETQGKELISAVNTVYAPASWKRIEEQLIYNNVLGTDIKQYVLRQGNREYLLWYWYDLHGRVTVSALKAKLYQGLARAAGSDTGVAAFSLYTEISNGRDTAQALLNNFVANNKTSLLLLHPSDSD